MKKKPRIIILCFAYNCEDYIEEMVESVLNQTYDNYLFLLSENGSTDKTRKLIHKYVPNPHIIYQETDYNNIIFPEKSTLKGWQELIELNEDDYITTLDSDDYFEDDALQSMAEAAYKYDADIVLSGCNMFKDGDRKSNAIRKPSKDRFYSHISQLSEDWIDVYGSIRTRWANLYRYNIYNQSATKLNAYKITNGGDTLQNIIAFGMAKNAVAISKVTVNYRIRTSSFYKVNINPERYMAYDFIHDESSRLLCSWGCNDLRVFYFLELVRESAMSDLIKNAALSQGNYELLNNIFKDEKFYMGLSRFDLKAKFLEEAICNINIYLKEDIKNQCTCFIIVLARAIKNKDIRLLLTALYSKENNLLWGNSFLEVFLYKLDNWIEMIFGGNNWSKIFLENNQVIRLILQGDYLEAAKLLECVNFKQLELFMEEEYINRRITVNMKHSQIVQKLDKGIDAQQEIEELLCMVPLDEEGIKYMLLNLSYTNNNEELLDAVNFAFYVHGDNVDILYMVALAFEYLSLIDNAIDCLHKAIAIAETEAEKNVFKEELNRIRNFV